MTLVIVTASLLLAWFVFVTRLGGGGLALRLVLAGTGACGQIALTSMVLSVAGLLTTAIVVVTSLTIAAGLFAAGLFLPEGRSIPLADRNRGVSIGRLPLRGSSQPLADTITSRDSSKPGALHDLRSDLLSVIGTCRSALGWDTALLGLVVVFMLLWLATAVVSYPPRGVDDLVYHLPAIYQAVQDHHFQILPLALRSLFAFPFSGEMPFLWMALLTHSARWVGASQVLIGLLAILSVYVLGRRYGLAPRGAVLAAGLFWMVPVVVLQATSNYVDLIVNAWVLTAAVALLRYEEARCRIALVLSGLSAGLVLGSKYQEIPFALGLSVIALTLIWRREPSAGERTVATAAFGVPVLAAGAYWYVRNWVLFANPFYPLPIRILGMDLFPGDWPQGPSIWSKLASDPQEALRIPLQDPGLGSLNGGFGFLFWGLSIPALVWLAARQLHTDRSRASGRLLVLGLVPVGFVALYLSPYNDLIYTFRYVLGVVPFGLIAIAGLAEEASSRGLGAATAIRATSLLGAFAVLLTAADSRHPLLSLVPVANDPPAARSMSNLRYLAYTMRDLGDMSRCWAPLDEMTRYGAGLSVYEAADYKIFWTAPTYGTELQNRIWNFEKNPSGEPDAFFFHTPRRTPFYVGREIHRETVAADPRYRLVASDGDDATTLYVSRAALAEQGREKRLIDFYERTEPEVIAATAPGAVRMEPGSLVLASFPMALGYLVHRSEGRLRAEIEPVTSKETEAAAARSPERIVYTFGTSLPGRAHGIVDTLDIRGRKISLVRNEPLVEGKSP